MRSTVFVILTVLLFWTCGAQKTFRNPIMDEVAPEPSVIKHEGYYFMVLGHEDNKIEILKSPVLSDFRNSERREVYQMPGNMRRLRAPIIQSVHCDLYIYFAMYGATGPRMYVIKSLDPKNPLGGWSPPVRLLPEEEIYSIHGNVMQYINGDLYLIWSGHPDSNTAIWNLYIARMETPMKVVGPRTLLRSPTMDWESNLGKINEGPRILQNHGSTILTFSASNAGSLDNCIGLIGIDGGRDPMLPSNWWNDVHHCIFARNDVEQVLAPAHASFVKSPDDSETWMVYHARYLPVEIYKNNTVRIQKIEWEMNKPVFPPAMGTDRYLVVPNGE